MFSTQWVVSLNDLSMAVVRYLISTIISILNRVYKIHPTLLEPITNTIHAALLKFYYILAVVCNAVEAPMLSLHEFLASEAIRFYHYLQRQENLREERLRIRPQFEVLLK